MPDIDVFNSYMKAWSIEQVWHWRAKTTPSSVWCIRVHKTSKDGNSGESTPKLVKSQRSQAKLVSGTAGSPGSGNGETQNVFLN
jgi:hypothetical protein